ncbi:Zinc finger CCCH domain-containing 11A protein [Tubulinosema ratisbonensis]|uniref:Zinc finger CCCH domain-containing 11A protein n=1 Tax=Tubulinosema ratisbonensis TaxID=291195 RepID=A0A437AJ52_9MICR|nr:Zinc finger CCCH domain-containing 11A protein [Tubulinosema ratisbonensis]
MLEDCYYFLYSKCRDPSTCQYRHSYSAKENPVTCETWARNKTCSATCPYRHSRYHENKPRQNEYCYWETKGGCKRELCEYKHINPKKDEWKQTKIQSLDELKQRKKRLEEIKEEFKMNTVNKKEDIMNVEQKLKEIDDILNEFE